MPATGSHRWKRGSSSARQVIDVDRPAPYGWAPLAILFLVSLVDRIENAVLPGTLTFLQAEWGLSDAAAGGIPTASAVVSALVALPAGYLADRFDRTRVISIVVLCWSVATLSSGFATGFAMFYASRVALAAADPFHKPASNSLLADYFAQVNRPKAYGLLQMTAYLGGIGTALGGILGETFGWRVAFLVMTLPGLLAALLARTLPEPARGQLDESMPAPTRERHRRTSSDGRARPGSDGPAPPVVAPPFGHQLRTVLRIPTLVLTSLGLMLITAGLVGIYFWMPSFIVRDHGVGESAASSLTGAISVIGVVLGTLVGAWAGRTAHTAIRSGRVVVGGSSAVVGALLLGGALLAGSPVGFSVLLLLASTVSSIAIPCVTAAITDVVGAESRGIGFACSQILLTTGAACGPAAVGFGSDLTGSLQTGLFILVAPMALGGLLIVLCRWFYEQDTRRVIEEGGHRAPVASACVRFRALARKRTHE